MGHRLSILQRATKADVNSKPFPHLILPNALPEDLYAELAASYPSPQALGIATVESNARWNYGSRKIRKNKALPKLWRAFIAYHSSQAFFDEIADLFFDHIQALYPERFPTRQSLTSMRAGIRKLDGFWNRDILTDAQISGNTPVITASSVRTTHVDNGDKLYSGLFYMRPATYDAVGGDLTISRFKQNYTAEERHALFDGPYVDDRHVDHLRTVHYDKNTVVLFINSLESLHGVTVREPSDKSRLFVNLVGEIDPPLYKVEGDGTPATYLKDVQRRRHKAGLLKRLKRLIAA